MSSCKVAYGGWILAIACSSSFFEKTFTTTAEAKQVLVMADLPSAVDKTLFKPRVYSTFTDFDLSAAAKIDLSVSGHSYQSGRTT